MKKPKFKKGDRVVVTPMSLQVFCPGIGEVVGVTTYLGVFMGTYDVIWCDGCEKSGVEEKNLKRYKKSMGP